MLMQAPSLTIFKESEEIKEAELNEEELESVLGDESQAVEPDEPTEETQDDEQFWYEASLIAEIAEASRNRESANNHLEELKEEAKEARATLKSCDARIFRLTRQLASKAPTAPIVDPASEESTNTERSEDPKPVSDTWREGSTEDLLQEVDGLGKKKIETLSELYPTVGELEDLRGQASEQHKPFKELLPKGFGQKAVDGIEDAILEYLTQQPAPPEETPSESSQSSEDHFAWVNQQVDEFVEKLENGLSVELVEKHNGELEMFIDGKEVAAGGRPVTECPTRVESDNPQIAISEEEQLQWVRGWVIESRS